MESVNHTIYNKTQFESADQTMIVWRRLFDAPSEDFENIERAAASFKPHLPHNFSMTPKTQPPPGC